MIVPKSKQAVIFIGAPASGKSTFYHEFFVDTHVRINLDMLRTRHRESLFLDVCLRSEQSFVVDNTNPTAEERAKYTQAASQKGFEVIGVYFQSNIEDCLQRNSLREGKKRIPEAGVRSIHSKIELPKLSEGFEALFYVKIKQEGFEIEEWKNEV